MAERGPTLVVAAAIVRGSKILLARRYQPELPEAHLKWELPGGKVKLEETPHDALIREIREELGTEIRIVRLLPHVQSNIYHAKERMIHAVIIAFESVISWGVSQPRHAETAVQEIQWVGRNEINKLDLLPGTAKFVQCLEQTNLASYSSANIYIRLERREPSGKLTDYWDIRSVYDLWKNFNLIERHGNLITRSSHYKVKDNIGEVDIFKELIKRVRSLVRHGYSVTNCDNPMISASIGLV